MIIWKSWNLQAALQREPQRSAHAGATSNCSDSGFPAHPWEQHGPLSEHTVLEGCQSGPPPRLLSSHMDSSP